MSNPAAQTLFGYSEEEFKDLSVEALMPSRYRNRHVENRLAFSRDPRQRAMHERPSLPALRKDGSEFIVEISLSPLDNGMVLAAVQDVTERKNLEAALRKFSRVIEQTASTVMITDPQGHIEYVNPRFSATTGYSVEEAIGQSPRIFKSGYTSEEEYRQLWETITAGEDWHGEFRNRRKDGSLYWASTIISPIRDHLGQITHFAAVMDDITERKRAAAALQAMNAEMEQVMRFQVASQTVASIAHELNQPLTALAGYADLALDLLRAGNPAPDMLQRAVESSAHQAQRAGHVVRELLAFLRRDEVKSEEVDINALAQQVLNKVATNGGGNFQARFEADNTVRSVRVNRLQLEKVIENLIQNGIEAMNSTHVDPRLITIAISSHAEKGFAQLTVSDTGPGIKEEILDQLFDPFFTTKPQGLGMGLTISRAVVEAHGGQLWVESRPGAGATFHLSLPAS